MCFHCTIVALLRVVVRPPFGAIFGRRFTARVAGHFDWCVASVTNASLSNAITLFGSICWNVDFIGSTIPCYESTRKFCANGTNGNVLAPAGFTLKIRIATLATNWSDADGAQ